jgi:hypothetical protein
MTRNISRQFAYRRRFANPREIGSTRSFQRISNPSTGEAIFHIPFSRPATRARRERHDATAKPLRLDPDLAD